MSPGKPHCTAAARGARHRRPAPCGVRRQAHARKPGGGLAVQFKQRRYRPRTAPHRSPIPMCPVSADARAKLPVPAGTAPTPRRNDHTRSVCSPRRSNRPHPARSAAPVPDRATVPVGLGTGRRSPHHAPGCLRASPAVPGRAYSPACAWVKPGAASMGWPRPLAVPGVQLHPRPQCVHFAGLRKR
jgi:hypothetical protein